MSPSPSVLSRFTEYYAMLDTQPPSALATLYHANAVLIDPFGQHRGLSAIQGVFFPSVSQRGAVPFRHRYAGLQRSAVCRRLDHALVASAPGRREGVRTCGLLDGYG